MEKTNTPILAGTLSIISAVFGFLGGLMFIGLTWFMSGFMRLAGEPEVESVFFFIQVMYIGLGIILIIMAILAVIGGVFAFKRWHWGWALTGSIASILAFFPTGIPAVVFVVQSKGEFNQAQQESG
jgi:hypothetical protein